MTFQQKLARFLIAHRAEAISQASGVSLMALSGLRRGKHRPRMQTVNQLAKALGVDAGWLFDDAKSWPPVRVGSPLLDNLDVAESDASASGEEKSPDRSRHVAATAGKDAA